MAELAREELADIARFSDNIDTLTTRIVDRVREMNSTLPSLPGCAELTAAKFISETANVTRFKSEAAFARYVGVAPVPAWSGTTRGRLRAMRGGNRQLNSALHRVAVVQIRLDFPGRTYFRRRIAEGDSGRTALRCVKRKVCWAVFQRLRAEYEHRNVVDAPTQSP
jgi:transposase